MAEQLGTCDSATHAGTIQSMNYPGDYPDNRDAFWHLIATHPDRTFGLTFQDFVFEYSSSCQYDSLTIE